MTIINISTSNTGIPANDSSAAPVFSPDGTKVAFVSLADNLTANDTNGMADIFIKDLQTGVVTRLTNGLANNQMNSPIGIDWNIRLKFSSDGSKLVFNDSSDAIWLTDIASGVSTLTAFTGRNALLVPSGNHIVFESGGQIYSGDLGASPTISVLASGNNVVFSANGQKMAFSDGTGVWIKDLNTNTTLLVTTGFGIATSFSPDGTKLAFFTDTALVPEDTNSSYDAYVLDLNNGQRARVSTAMDGTEANGLYGGVVPVFSADGTKVIFFSNASNLVVGDTNNVIDVFVKDIATGAISRLNISDAGIEANADSFHPYMPVAVSPDGTKVIFSSAANNLTANDFNNAADLFMVSLAGGGGGSTGNTVYSAVTYFLAPTDVNLVLTGVDDISGYGNNLNNTLTGNSADNSLFGGDGNDTLIGGAGDDTYLFSGGQDVISAAAEGSDWGYDILELTGLSMQQTRINKEANGDLLITINGSSDSVRILGVADWNSQLRSVLFVDDWLDSYQISGNWAYGSSESNVIGGTAGVDSLVGLAGDDSLNGDDGDDYLYGNEGNDTLNGGAGWDNLRGGEGNDVLNGGAERDVLWGDDGDDTLNGGDGDDHLYGDDGNDYLYGNEGNDYLRGDNGANVLQGGAGNDTYSLQNYNVAELSTIIEQANEGIDEVTSWASYTLGANLENLSLWTGSAGTGNSLSNVIRGNRGNNILDGGLGIDTLIGDEGDDTYIVDNIGDIVTEDVSEGIDTVQSSISYTLAANLENLALTGIANLNGTGNSLNNNILGNSGNNILTGLAGNDLLNGGSGADTLIGGLGNDTYVVDNVGDVVTESSTLSTEIDTVEASISYTLGANVESLILTGTSAINGTGNSLANTLTGNSGNNLLDGGSGADTHIGGLGNDTYIVGNVADVIIELANQGIDTVSTATAYTLGANLENLILTGTSAVNGAGNELANTLTGNSANNRLNGGTGADTLVGGVGNDTYVIDNIGDVVTEASTLATEIDTVETSLNYTLGANVESLILTGTSAINGTGNGLANTVTGNSGNNLLDGGSGADTHIGGLGNDTYIVGNVADVITELANQGTDTVSTATAYSLGANLENLILTGASAVNGTGNELANTLTGNSANNRLNGGTGADKLVGGVGNDTYVIDNIGDVVTESSTLSTEIDTVEASISYTLGANLEKLVLTGTAAINGTGNGLANTVTGNSGNNLLDGGSGADTHIGGLGNDTYIVGNVADVIVELANQGIDTVSTATTYTLGANLENLTLTGTSAVNGTGNSLANTLTGNSNNNRLDGGTGADTLIGGLGNDSYVFNLGGGVDRLIENDSTAANTDVLSFLGSIAYDQLWFSHVGTNLEVSVIGTTDKVIVQDWYVDSSRHVEQIKASSNKTLLDTEVESLVTAMAALTPPPLGQTTLTAQQHSQLDSVLAANWS